MPPLPPQFNEDRGSGSPRGLSLATAALGLCLTGTLTVWAQRSARSGAQAQLRSEVGAAASLFEARTQGLLEHDLAAIGQLAARGDWDAARLAAQEAQTKDPGLAGVLLLRPSTPGTIPGQSVGVFEAVGSIGKPSGGMDALFLGRGTKEIQRLAEAGGHWLDLQPPGAPGGHLRLYLACDDPAVPDTSVRGLVVLEMVPREWLWNSIREVDGLVLSANDGSQNCQLGPDSDQGPAPVPTGWRTIGETARLHGPFSNLTVSAARRLGTTDTAGLMLLLTLGGGLALTAFGYGATRTLERSHAAVQREVRERTRALRREMQEREDAEQRLRDIVETADEYLWEQDLAGCYTFLTRPIESVLARPVAAILGHSFFELMPPGQARRLRSWWQELLEERRPFKDLECEVRRPDGSTRWVRVSGQPVFARGDLLVGYRGTGLDITDARQANERLDAQRKELQLILDALPAMVFYKDAHNKILRVNRAVCEVFGRPIEEIEGQQVEALLPAADAAGYLSHDQDVILTGRPKLGILSRLEDGKGHRRHTRIDKIPLPVEAFGEPRIVSVVTDISESQRIEQKLELALRGSGLSLWDWDLRADQLDVGSGWARMLGHSSTPQTLDAWLAYALETDRDAASERLRGWLLEQERGSNSGNLRLELRLRAADGQPRWVLAILEVADRDAEGQPLRISGVQLDIEELKETEARLQAAKLAAEQANNTKSEFLANMSHEIRTPMNAILGFADLLDVHELPDEQRRDYLSTIRRNGQGLLSLINDILDLSKIESGQLKVQRERIDLATELEHVRRTMEPLALRKGLELRVEIAVDCPADPRTDPGRLQQILINLVGNAIKFTHSGWVCLRAVRGSAAGRLAIQIEDTGIGVAKEKLEEIFQPFSQGDNSVTRRFGGTGLGLTISRRLAAILGGELSVRSSLGEGSVFCLELPESSASVVDSSARQPAKHVALESTPGAQPSATATAGAGVRSTSAKGSPLAGRRILVVDDGEDNRRLCRVLLQRAGAIVELAEDGIFALERLHDREQEPIDLVLLDMQMPRLDGYQTTTQLRAEACPLPILALTAHAMEGDREKCLAAGCDDFTTKPVQAQKLVELCASWLIERRRLASA